MLGEDDLPVVWKACTATSWGPSLLLVGEVDVTYPVHLIEAARELVELVVLVELGDPLHPDALGCCCGTGIV